MKWKGDVADKRVRELVLDSYLLVAPKDGR
jgi:hypothetical protein